MASVTEELLRQELERLMIPENLPYVPKQDFNSEEIAVLEQAFESARATIGNHGQPSVASEDEAKTGLRRLICALASQGVKDPHTLKNLAVLNSPLRHILLEREAERTAG